MRVVGEIKAQRRLVYPRKFVGVGEPLEHDSSLERILGSGSEARCRVKKHAV